VASVPSTRGWSSITTAGKGAPHYKRVLAMGALGAVPTWHDDRIAHCRIPIFAPRVPLCLL
jgi:hypothetical protein